MSEERQESEAQSPLPEPTPSGLPAETEADPAAPRRQSIWRRLAVAIALLAALAGAGYFGVWTLMPVSTDEKKVVIVEIPRNWGARRIADRLHERGLIRNRTAFLLAGHLLGDLQHLKAGEYELSPSMTPVEILDKLARGDVKAYWVTVPEGVTIKEIAAIFHKMRLIDPTRFVTLATRGGMRIGAEYGVPRKNLEGYLFPDTYKVPRAITERELIRIMVRSFHQQVERGLAQEIAERTNGLSLDETIVLASLVEREARVTEERARIAGVLVNRLRRGMRLECDATVQYALGKTKERLLYSDLKVDSPYNTYLNSGLPPAPICNPGLASIRAALKPEKHGYLFYVAVGTTGRHIFTRTFAEHKAAIRKVRGG
ncbi:MAG TPA: endolytic transglycosylase MltG [Armatimonadota bacterium]|nr:endolytic transglycosylase MltG [Armatimonadota bacterium]HPO72145.1 endolytic transglycosylase MltG [Armatimonadota bacterium]